MKGFFNSLWSWAILAIVSLITLFASGCTPTHVQHVSETPVDSAIFQNLYQCGSDTIIMAFDSTRVNGVGCKSGKSYSELRWNPSHSFTLTKCGPSFDFKKAVGLAHNQELSSYEKKRRTGKSNRSPSWMRIRSIRSGQGSGRSSNGSWLSSAFYWLWWWYRGGVCGQALVGSTLRLAVNITQMWRWTAMMRRTTITDLRCRTWRSTTKVKVLTPWSSMWSETSASPSK